MELWTIPLGAEGEMSYISEVKATTTQPFVHSELQWGVPTSSTYCSPACQNLSFESLTADHLCIYLFLCAWYVLGVNGPKIYWFNALQFSSLTFICLHKLKKRSAVTQPKGVRKVKTIIKIPRKKWHQGRNRKFTQIKKTDIFHLAINKCVTQFKLESFLTFISPLRVASYLIPLTTSERQVPPDKSERPWRRHVQRSKVSSWKSNVLEHFFKSIKDLRHTINKTAQESLKATVQKSLKKMEGHLRVLQQPNKRRREKIATTGNWRHGSNVFTTQRQNSFQSRIQFLVKSINVRLE